METQTRAQLEQTNSTIEYMANLDGQDTMLVVEMAQAMIGDMLTDDTLKPLSEYVRRYCDVIDGPDDVESIVADITGVHL